MRSPRSIAILGCGRSLNAWLAAPVSHDVVIGLNRAASAYPCDYMVFTDHEAFQWYPPMGTPILCTSAVALTRLQPHRGIGRYQKITHEQIAGDALEEYFWRNLSVTVAVVLADHLAGTELHLHGVDCVGIEDWDGARPPRPAGRSNHRWQNEEHRLGHLLAWAIKRGMDVTRHTQPAEVA